MGCDIVLDPLPECAAAHIYAAPAWDANGEDPLMQRLQNMAEWHLAASPQGGAANPGCSRLSSRLVGITRQGRSRLESRLQAGLPAPQFVASRKETTI
jgi:hypothetical protein